MGLRAMTGKLLDRFGPGRTAGQLARFSVIGLANTFLDFAVYVGLTRPFPFWSHHFIAANVISFTCAATSSFIANTFWTFQSGGRGWHRRFIKFFLVATGGMLINSLMLAVLTGLGVYDLIAKVAATAVVLVWNFVLQKKWTFRN